MPCLLPLQCAVIQGQTREARDENCTRDNRRNVDRRRENNRTRGTSRTRDNGSVGDTDDYTDDDEPSSEETLERLQLRVSPAAFQRAKDAVLGRYIMPRNAPYDEWLCYQKLLFR